MDEYYTKLGKLVALPSAHVYEMIITVNSKKLFEVIPKISNIIIFN
jgi:hypothetical protein